MGLESIFGYCISSKSTYFVPSVHSLDCATVRPEKPALEVVLDSIQSGYGSCKLSRPMAVSKTIDTFHTEVTKPPTEVPESPQDHKEIKTPCRWFQVAVDH